MPNYRKRAFWTPETLATLTEMRLAGSVASEIAAVLGPGFTKEAVNTKASNLGLPAPSVSDWTPERIDRMKALWADGLTATQVAKQMNDGATRASVLGKLDRLNLLKTDRGTQSRTPKKPRALPQVKAKRVTLPPLPINGPVLTSDTKLLKSAAWLALPGTEPKALTDLGANECRWPIGENPTLFCGCATEKLYCPAHAAIAYRPFPGKVKK